MLSIWYIFGNTFVYNNRTSTDKMDNHAVCCKWTDSDVHFVGKLSFTEFTIAGSPSNRFEEGAGGYQGMV